LLDHTYYSCFENLFITGCNNGIHLSHGYGNTFQHIYCERNHGCGFLIDLAANANTFMGCVSRYNDSHGFHFRSEPGSNDRLHGCSVLGGNIECNDGNGVFIDNADEIRLVGVYLENNGNQYDIQENTDFLPDRPLTCQIRIRDGNYCVISACNISGNSNCETGGVYIISQSSGNLIEGCRIRDQRPIFIGGDADNNMIAFNTFAHESDPRDFPNNVWTENFYIP